MNIKKNLVYKIVLSLLCVAMIVLSCVFLQTLNRALKVVVIVFFTLGVFIFCFIKNKTLFRIATVFVVFFAVVIVLYVIVEQTGLLKYFEDFDAIRDFILRTKQWGVIVFLLLTIFQVVFLPIPAAVTILIGVVIYGPLVSFILSLVGTYIGSVICFWLGKNFGSKLVAWMIGKENFEKYAKMLNEKGKWVFVLMLVFPFFPDDTLCLVAGATTMTWKFFLISMILSRPIGIAFTSFFGSGEIIPYSGWGIPVWIGIFALCIVLLLLSSKIKNKLLGDKTDKRK